MHTLVAALQENGLCLGSTSYIQLMRPLRLRGQEPIFQRPNTHSKKLLQNIKSMNSLELPNIYSRSLKTKPQELSLQSSNDIRKELSKVVSFGKEKTTAIQGGVLDRLPEQVKGIINSSDLHKDINAMVNKIFNSCDIFLVDKDLLLVEGKRSQAKYVIINNGPYRPKSVCCQEQVVVRCIDKSGIEEDRRMSRKLQLICLACQKIILKIVEKQGNNGPQIDKKRKLLDFALHIASGRYKKHKMDESINETISHIKSRVIQHLKPTMQGPI